VLFPTGIFAIFFAAVFLGHWTLVRVRPSLDRWFLLAANLVFYAFWSLEFCAALIAVGLWTWGVGLLAARGRSRPVLWVGVAGVLGWLFYFKYANFFLQEIVARLGFPAPILDVVLPVGISFYCFQAISYMVDVYADDAEVEANPLNVLVYLTFFPHLAAGPIVRAAHFLPQLRVPPDRYRIPVAMAGILILGGLFKKMIIANELATGIVDPVFRDPTAYGAWDIVLACYGYTIQIFCDFSAYSDMAIGFAALLGFHFPKNFDQPFRAVSLSEFWRRWHISLSTWLRDYLYIRALGGNRRGEARTRFNLMATMILGGIWHGANWTFLLWGAIHGAALAIERALGGRAQPSDEGSRLPALADHLPCGDAGLRAFPRAQSRHRGVAGGGPRRWASERGGHLAPHGAGCAGPRDPFPSARPARAHRGPAAAAAAGRARRGTGPRTARDPAGRARGRGALHLLPVLRRPRCSNPG
jgi:alginate O-acetyltransferase complex protein AlgI